MRSRPWAHFSLLRPPTLPVFVQKGLENDPDTVPRNPLPESPLRASFERTQVRAREPAPRPLHLARAPIASVQAPRLRSVLPLGAASTL